ncbi:MAG: T9SS type A sorting domain-containing protein, partial [Bacteroidia bacterium]|nr:T9SS type A sorting domain-containing protein [Bacteroidia bacterium]
TDNGENLAFTGPVFTDDVNVPITNVGPSFELWNLIGNPYPSYIRLDEFLTTNSTELFNDGSNDYRAVYGYNANSSDQWTIWNSAYSTVNPDALITPGQGFFVAAASSSSSISFTKSMRTIGTDDDFITTNRASNTYTNAFAKFNLSYDTYNFGTDIYFIEGTTQGLDSGYDTNAFNNNAAGIFTALLQNSTNEELAIQSLPYSDLSNVVVPVGVKVNAGIQATISLNDTENTLPSEIIVYLEDNETNTWTLLNDSDYIFTPSVELTGVGRFFLHFTSSTLSNQDFESSSLLVYANQNDKTVVVKGNLLENTELSIYDIHGSVILQHELNANTNSNTVSVNHLNTGIYIVTLKNETQNKIKKVIIN